MLQYEREEGFKQGMEKGIEKGRQEGIEKGRQEGIEKGRQEGIEKGIKENQILTAKNMKNKNMDLNLISELTGLSIKEIENL